MTRKKAKRTKEKQFALDCKKATSLIQDFITGELNPDIASESEQHLSICPDCVAFLNTYKKTIQAVRSIYSKSSQKMKNKSKKFPGAKMGKEEL